MSENVIRQDIIQLDFDVDDKELQDLRKELSDLKKDLGGDLGDDAFDEFKNETKDATKETDSFRKKIENLAKTGFTKLKSGLKTVSTQLTTIAKKASTAAFNGLKKVASISFKALTIGATAVATAIGKIAYESVQAYGEYEQLKGGMLKIFDKADTKQIMKDAENAYIDLGMSVNQYLGKINDTGANFASSMGDQKGYETARTGMLAISNYASGTGKSIDLLSEKFTMITRASSSYQSIADQFSGILPATSKDFLKQAQAAGFLGKGYKKLTDVPIAEYQESVAKMLEKGVKELGLAGNTAAEAEGTVTGSLGMMKAAWSNLLVSFGTGEGLDKNFDNFIKAAEAFGVQTIPIVEKSLLGIGKVVEKLAPVIAEKLPQLAEDLLPPLIRATIDLTKGLIKALPSIAETLVVSIADVLTKEFPALKSFGEGLMENAKKIGKIVPYLIGAFAGFKVLKTIMPFVTGLFSKGSKGGGKGGFLGNLGKELAKLGKTKSGAIVKGMANLSIIFGGFALLTGVFSLVAPLLAKIGDPKTTAMMILVIGELGAVSGGLAYFAGIVGKIPISTVAKGIANMAIMLAGMSALFLLVGAVSLIKFDLGRIAKIALLIGVLGTVGAALSVFAGIVGMIPIPVVLAGLANMALVLGGVSALIVAFGALSEIEGFNEFITKGGETLANIFNVIGKCVGSIIGGLGEGLTNSLPKIGENLSAFAESIKPMFTTFAGVDMSGIGSFFKAIGSFMLQMAGNKILEFFTGKTDFSGVVNGLKTLTSEDVKKFFAMVNTIPVEAFDKGKKFFECLDGISSLPNTGGLGQLFSGENDFAGVAAGLERLNSKGVKGFFAMVGGFKQEAFDNAKAFFKSLDGISSLPNVGGLGQLFAGENDFEGVANGLNALSKQGVKNFFAMVSKLDSSVFTKTTELFAALADIGNVGEEGFWERVGKNITGDSDKPSGITKIASELSSFAEKTQSFFTQINSLNIGKLNGLWNSLKKAGTLTTKNLSTVIDESISTLVSKISELPKKMGDAMKKNSGGLSNGFVEMWKDAVKASVAPVNKLLDGANHILKEFGSKKKVITWQPYARGTDGHKGGNALVNDGRGAELVQMPNGRMFIPNGRNVFMPNAPKGMKVLPAEQTARLLGRKSPTFNYADGTGGIDVWSYIDNAKGLVNKIAEKVSYKGMSGLALNIGQSVVSTFKGEMSSWVDKLFEEEGALGLADYVASKGVNQWKSTVIRALKMEGQYNAANVKRTLYQMQTESGGNPRAINLWDSNAKKGIPSKGLMQVIDPTFKAYARSGFNKNIYDPLSNILASVRYATSRYGSLAKAYRGVGYSKGVGTISMPQQSSGVSLSYSPESDSGYYSSTSVENNTYAPHFELNISGTNDDRAMERKVKRWIVEAWQDMIDNLESKTPRTHEV